jgi:hypothetical protein
MTTPEAIGIALIGAAVIGLGFVLAMVGVMLVLHVIGWKP